MKYHRSSIHVNYNDYYFDSRLELAWYLFLTERPGGFFVEPHPLNGNDKSSWEPDIALIHVPKWYQEQKAYVEIKPLTLNGILNELKLEKYQLAGYPTLILGINPKEIFYQLHFSTAPIIDLLQSYFDLYGFLWHEIYERSGKICTEKGSLKSSNLKFDDGCLDVGKYKGQKLQDIKMIDPDYYYWYCFSTGIDY